MGKRISDFEYNYFDTTVNMLVGKSYCADKRRPPDEAYLKRPDLPVIGEDFSRRVLELAAQGVCRPQIAEQMRCNLRDVFRVIEGEDYLRRFALEHTPRKALTARQELIVEIIRGDKNADASELLQEFQCSNAELWHIAEVGGVEKEFRDLVNPERDPKKLKEEKRQKVSYLLQRTLLSQEAIAKKYGVSRRFVYNVLIQRRIKRRFRRGDCRRRVSKKDFENVIALAKQGLSQSELSRRFGFHRDTIRLIERRAGYKRQIRGRAGGKLIRRAA